jgi:hypothetical protein
MRIGLCIDCNYPLHSLPANRCPECGRAFDPNDARTMNMGRPMGALVRWVIVPIGWPLIIFMSPLTLGLLWLATSPSSYFVPEIGLIILWLLVVAVFSMVVVTLRLGVRHTYRQPAPPANLRTARRIGIAFVLLVSVLFSKLPMRIGFWTARAELQRMESAIRSGTPAMSLVGKRAGGYRISPLWVGEHTIHFGLGRGNDFFVRSAPGQHPERIAFSSYGSLGDDWYWYSDE